MNNKEFKSNLERLGVDLSSSEMQVFKAVFAAGGMNKSVKYGEIASSLESMTGRKKPFTKAYIYRRLNELAQSGFIAVDTISTPRTYTITEVNVERALESIRQEKLSESLKQRQEITTQLNRLKHVRGQELALMLHKQLAGISSIGDSQMIEGVENVRSTIIREFADRAKEGDVLRILGHASTLAEGLGPGGVTELRVMQAGFRGVTVLGLLTPVGQESLDLNLMAGHLTPHIEVFDQVAKTGNIHLKFSREPIRTYRIVSLNEDKMLLYLTHAKESDVAALIHRKDNPGLIDDAIRTFNELWETGVDVLEIVRQMLQKKQAS